MKPSSTLFLKAVVSLIGIAVLVLCIYLLSVAINSGEEKVFLLVVLGMCIAAIPFLFALYQTFKLLIYIDKGSAFSEFSVKALRNIRYCAFAICALYAAIMPFMVLVADTDDAPGFAALGIVIILASTVIATFAAVLQKLLQDALDIKAENDLMV